MHPATMQFEGAWSFGQSKKSEWYLLPGKDVPGPGEYDQKCNRSLPKWTMGRAERIMTQQSDVKVGAGSYELNLSAVVPASRQPTIGNEGKKVRNLRMKTGVDYTPNYAFGKAQSPSISMGYYMDTDYSKPVPGPADYQPLKTEPTTTEHSQKYFTVSKRPSMHSRWRAAVGMYNVSSPEVPDHQRIRFGTSLRPSLNMTSPGTYSNIETKQKDNAGYTIGRRLPISFNKDNFPAPNQYLVRERHKYDTRLERSMYTGSRSQVVTKDTQSKPSPGMYNIAGDLVQPMKAVVFSESKRPQQTPLINVPGPGSYEYKSSLNNTLGKMSWRLSHKFKTEVPAPGAYDLDKPVEREFSKSWKGMHLSLRPEIGLSTTHKIGPGEYQVLRRENSELGSMTRSERRCITTTKNPGPGQYEIPSTIGRIPKYYKKVVRKLDDNGCTKTIKYDPKATGMVKLGHMLAPPEEAKKKEQGK